MALIDRLSWPIATTPVDDHADDATIDDDPLRAARGIRNGLIASALIWGALGGLFAALI